MRKTILVASVVAGLAASATGLLLAGGVMLVAWIGRARDPGSPLQMVTMAAGFALLGPGLGLALAWSGWRALRGRPARPFKLPRWGWWLFALLLVLGLGQVAFSAELKALVPFAHIAAGVFPALLFLSLVLGSAQRGGGAITARPAIGSISWGGLGGASLAITAEAIILGAAMLAVFLWLAVANPSITHDLEAAALEYQRSGDLQALSGLTRYLISPLAVLGILSAVGILIPLVEEGVKALAVPLVAATGRNLTRLDGFLLGAAAGAGFALVEGVMNGMLVLGVPERWALMMGTRAGTAAIHCAASGLCGLGWQAILSERRLARGLGLGLAAVALHGIWNLAAIGQALIGLGSLGPAAQAILALLVVGIMATVWGIALLLLVLLPRRLAQSALYPPLGNQSHEAQDEPVDQKRVQEGAAAPGEPAE